MNRNKEPILKPVHPALKRRIILYFIGATIFCSTFVFFSVVQRTQIAKESKQMGIFSKAGIIKKESKKETTPKPATRNNLTP